MPSFRFFVFSRGVFLHDVFSSFRGGKRAGKKTNKTAGEKTKKNKKKTSDEKLSRVAQSVGHLTRKSGVLGSIPGLATYFHFSFRFFKKGSCLLLAKVCARSTG